jgi:beta-galactosidase
VSDDKYTVPGTSDGIVYYDRRTGTSFSYNLPVADGTYTVELFFTDPITPSQGSVFNVTAQGQTVLNHFDIIAAGGGKSPLTKKFTVDVTNGKISLGFTGIVNDATLSGIEVLIAGI